MQAIQNAELGKKMYSLKFYKDEQGNSPTLDFIVYLSKKSDKDSRIKFRKISEYLKFLREGGTYCGEPYVKHILKKLKKLHKEKLSRLNEI